MAECSYARCVQERRAIKKELQRWTKNMVFVVGLERVAEELMGRRKWKQYQEIVLKAPLKIELEPEIQDWEPQDKCCMCDGTSFLDSAASPAASDSGSTGTNSQGSSSLRETPPGTLPYEGGHSAAALNDVAPSLSSSASGMTTLQSVTSMAASLAALGSNSSHRPTASTPLIPTPPGALPFYPPPPHHHSSLFPHWYLSPPHPQVTGRTIPSPATALAEGLRHEAVPSTKQDHSTTSPIVMALPPSSSATEQPLDLSAKAVACGGDIVRDCNAAAAATPTPDQSLRVPSVDNKHIFKAKPRMSTVAGRRTYTEEELQAALRDIQSGKLGTRRAAVIYGIPRSTLRNKVYKLALERERDSHLVVSNNSAAAVVQDSPVIPKAEEPIREEEEKDLSGAEEEREVEKTLRKPLLSMEDLVRFSVFGAGQNDPLRTLLQHGRFLEGGLHRHSTSAEDGEDGTPPPTYPGFTQNLADLWGGMEHSALGPYVSQFLAASAAGHNRDINPSGGMSTPGDKSPTGGDFLPKFPTPLLPEFVRRMMAEDMKKQHHFHPNGAHADENTEERQKLTHRPSTISSLQDTATEDTEVGATASGTATPPSNVILKIPSFKPTSKNGVACGSGGSEVLSSPVAQESSSQQFILSDSCSPPIIPPSLVGKGIGVSLREVIAKSISQKFQQHGSSDIQLPPKLLLGHDEPPYKRGRFTPPLSGSAPTSVIKHNNNNSQADDRNAQKVSSQVVTKPVGSCSGSQGGKGTRPKRGKYRNYDRDSLIEAVRAVQRGEMSVHRAGSHFGVPHSTLEYKVKERHLMRPRKREPKPHVDDSKKKEESNILRHSVSSLDKPKIPSKSTPKAPFTPSSSAIPSAPNGLKIPPMFDPANMSPMPYATAPPFPFWPPNPFHSLPIPEFPRGSAGYSPTPEFFASQMMQRLQEESSRVHAGGGDGNSPVGVCTSSSRSPPLSNLGKSAREMAESLYDGTGANGSFLDGIIRSSLEMGLPKEAGSSGTPENMSNKALLDQLCRNSRLTPLPRAVSLPLTDGGASSSDDDSIKRSSSRSAYGCSNIKTGATESDASTSAIIDLSPSSNGSTADHDIHQKRTTEDEGDDNATSPLVEMPEDTKTLPADADSPSKESKDSATDDENDDDDESACDIIKRVDKDAAKDGEGEEDPVEQEDTKSKINSLRD